MNKTLSIRHTRSLILFICVLVGIWTLQGCTSPAFLNPSAAPIAPSTELKTNAPASTRASNPTAWATKQASQQPVIVQTRSGCGLGLLDSNVRIWIQGQNAQQTCRLMTAMIRQQGHQPTNWNRRLAESVSDYKAVCSDAMPTFSYEVIDTGNQIYGTEWCQWVAQTYGSSGSVTAPDLLGVIGDARVTQNAVNTQVNQQNAVRDANSALETALSNLDDTVKSLALSTNFDDVLKQYATDWDTMQKDIQKINADAAVRPFDCYQLGNVKYDVGTINYDLGSIHYDDGSYKYVVNTVNGDISHVNDNTTRVRNAWNSLTNAVSMNTTGIPSPQFCQKDIDDAITLANSQIAKSTDILQAAQKQVAVFDQEAAQLDKAANDYVSVLQCQ